MHEITHPKKRAFLAAYIRCASITTAAKRAKCSREAHYAWLREDPAYSKAFKQAIDLAGDSLEDEAARRAFAGSDVLMIFLLKGVKPWKYRERYEFSGPNGKPIEHNISATESLMGRIASIVERRRAEGSNSKPDGTPG